MKPHWLPRRRPIRRSRDRAGGRTGAVRRIGQAVAVGATAPFTYRSELAGVAGDSRRPLTFRRHDADSIEAELYSHLIPIKRRIWVQRAVLLIVRAAVLIAGLYLIAATLQLARLPLPQPVLSGAAIFVAALALLLIVQQRVSYFDAARVLDRRLGLNQVVGTAVELTGANADGRLARLQMRRATDVLRRLESRDAIKIGLPIRDLRMLAVLAVATLLFSYLATLSIAWPGSAPPGEGMLSDPAADIIADVPYESTSYDGDSSSTIDPELFNSSLDDYRSDLESQNLSPEEIAQRLAEIQAALAQRAEALNRQRQALSDLADALSDSSAASDAAESIRKGDYQKAAQQLGDLGKQSKQLSQRARQDLARRLNDASKKVSPNNQDLANRMQKAAQQLNSNDAGAEQSLSELGEGVQQAGDQMKQLSDSQMDPSSMDPSMGMGDQDGQAMPSDLSAEDTAGLSSYEGSDTDMGEQPGDSFDSAPGGAEGQSGASAQGAAQRGDQGGDEASRGAGAGGGPGGPDAARPQDGRTPTGKVLELRGRPSDGGGPGQLDDNGKVPLVASNDGSIGGVGDSAGRAIVDPLSIRGEQNFVPWEKRQIVRDFFTGTGK